MESSSGGEMNRDGVRCRQINRMCKITEFMIFILERELLYGVIQVPHRIHKKKKKLSCIYNI